VKIFFSQKNKIESKTVIREKLRKTLKYKKAASKMLAKLTPTSVVIFTNILRAS